MTIPDTEDYVVFDRAGTPHVVVAAQTEIGGNRRELPAKRKSGGGTEMSDVAKMFYCTTGWQSGKPSMVHPIKAYSVEQARDWMFETYGGNWCTSHTEEVWNAWTERMRAEGTEWLIEKAHPLVDLTSENEEERR